LPTVQRIGSTSIKVSQIGRLSSAKPFRGRFSGIGTKELITAFHAVFAGEVRESLETKMSHPQIQLCLVLHNHQPVGNFDNVFEAAYQDSYLPFLDLFETFPGISISLHTSGPLMVWLKEKHPDYVNRLSQLADEGRVEIIGGAFYEPILSMIPHRDRVGQIKRFTHWLKDWVSTNVQGMWMPERVWESQFVSSLQEAGIHYTVLDDFHFRRAGLTEEQLTGYFVLEDEGRIVRVFPGSERLRYLIPFASPHETIDYCRQIAQQSPDSVIVFGDDGEKFGTWPETKKHVYQDGWLKQFFQALTDNRHWLKTSTLRQAVETTSPCGKIYLPDASYREMIEWALPVSRQREYDYLVHEMEHHPLWPALKNYVTGGFWRNFKVKYPETNLMYARMMYVSKLLDRARSENVNRTVLDAAEDHLYQGQCNCSYWHGAFGGIYLPHLRNAVYQHLLAAENLLESGLRPSSTWVEATIDDYDFDDETEIRLANDQLSVWLTSGRGGQIYELDIRNIEHNLNATLQRPNDLYHDKVKQGQQQSGEGAKSIHDRIVFKQPDLEQRLHYDLRPRNSLIDHFRPAELNAATIQHGNVEELGDFADASYRTTIRRNPGRIQVMMECEGNAEGVSLKITKGVTLNAGSDTIEIAYLIENLPADRRFNFGVEFNFSGLPDRQEDRFFADAQGNPLGQFHDLLDLQSISHLSLNDHWLGLNVELNFETAATVHAYPVQTVSQSESGFELVHQSVAVEPHWQIESDEFGRWSTVIQLTLKTKDRFEKKVPSFDGLIASS
jgi:4-alpha-glucanotransferase